MEKEYKKKTPKKSFKIPKGTKRSKHLRITIWLIVVGLSCSGVLAFIYSASALDLVQKVESQVSDFIKVTEEDEQSQLYSFQLESFVNEFVPLYMNVSNNSTTYNKQQEELKEYYSDEIEVVPITPVGTRTLNSYEMYDVQEEHGVIIVSVLVNYTSQAPAVPTQTIESVLNIPVVETEENQFVVVEQPYFTSAPDKMGTAEETPKVADPYESETQVDAEVSTEVNAFLNEFYTLYAASTAEEMQYMMAEPEGLGGDYKFVSQTSQVYQDIENSEMLVVKSQVIFQESNSDIKHTENMTLTLSKTDGKYYVETMEHTVGGKELK